MWLLWLFLSACNIPAFRIENLSKKRTNDFCYYLAEVLVDLTDSAPPPKKIWPEIMDTVDAAPPADAKKGKGKGKGADKKIDVSSKRHP